MPVVGVSQSFQYIFNAEAMKLDFSRVPENQLEAVKDKKRKDLLNTLLGSPEADPAKLIEFWAKHGANEALGKFLFGDDFKIQQESNSLISEARVRVEFDKLKAKYKYEVTFEEYSNAVKACFYQAEVIEGNNHGDEVYTRAYKMLAVFGEMKQFDSFVKSHASSSPNPVHDVLQREIPVATGIKLEGWRNLIMKSGMAALQGFENAARIPEAPKNKEELNLKLGELSYPRAKENPSFAKLCRFYNVSVEVFNRTLDLNLKLKKADNIPDVVVKAEDLDASAKGVYLVKLPPGNLRGAILGKITDCCQSIGGHSEKCVIDGLTRESNTFYIMIKASNAKFDVNNIDWENLESNAKIVGQGYVWRTRASNLVMDSWEGLGTSYDWLMPKMLQKFAEEVHKADPSIDSVNIGAGGKTPEAFKTNTATEQMKEGYFYGDSSQQCNVYTSEALKAKRAELAKRTGIEDQTCVFNTHIADKLLSLKDAQLKNITKDRYAVLVSPVNIEWTVANTENISSLDPVLFSDSVISVYQRCNINVADLKGLPESRIQLLTSYNAVRLYEAGLVSFTDLKDLPESRIKLLISGNALTAYAKGKVTFADLKDLPENKIDLLISGNAFMVYAEGKVTFTDLKELPESRIKLLISGNALMAYRTGKVTFADLKDLPESRIKLVISYAAIAAYRNGKATLEDLSVLTEEISIFLNTRNVEEAYETGKVTFADLKDLTKSRIELVTSGSAIAGYKAGIVTFADLKDLPESKIMVMTSWYAINVYETGKVSFADLKDLPENKIKVLTSTAVEAAYKTGKVTFADLKDLPESKIQSLTSYNARRLYETGKATFADLKDLPESKIYLLISANAMRAYETGKVSVADLIDLPEGKIQLLISESAIAAYQFGKATFSDLNNLTEDEFALLTSFGAELAYKTGKITFADLKSLPESKVKILISEDAVYKAGKATFADLKDLSEERLKLLNSEGVVAAYKTGKVTFADLKDLPEEKIRLLTSAKALEAYNTGKVSIAELKDLPEEGIQYNIAWHTKGVFQGVVGHFPYALQSAFGSITSLSWSSKKPVKPEVTATPGAAKEIKKAVSTTKDRGIGA